MRKIRRENPTPDLRHGHGFWYNSPVMSDKKKWLRTQAEKVRAVDYIDPSLYRKYGVKRGLRDDNGIGVLVGLTTIGTAT